MNPQYTNVKVDSRIPYFSGQPENEDCFGWYFSTKTSRVGGEFLIIKRPKMIIMFEGSVFYPPALFLRLRRMARWWFQIFFMFTPIPREMIQFDEHIFQMG